VVVSLEKHILPYSFILINLCSNNVDQYQALILGLEMTIGMGIKDLSKIKCYDHIFGSG